MKAPGQAAPAPARPLTREQIDLAVGKSVETWKLVWNSAPQPYCSADDSSVLFSCSCQGFSYGESGSLNLIRTRKNKEFDRFDLTHLFQGTQSEGQAVIQRWEPRASDPNDLDSANVADWLRYRPQAIAMRFGDYNHDGMTAEFFLQTDTALCGKRLGVVMGVTKEQPKMHALTSAAHPEKPLVMDIRAWDAMLRSESAVRVITWACGDHGSQEETELELIATHGDIRVKQFVYDCSPSGRGRLLTASDY